MGLGKVIIEKSRKAEFTEVGIFFLLQLFARDISSMKELEIEEI